MKTLIPINHEDALEALRDGILTEIKTYVTSDSATCCGKNEELSLKYKDGGPVQYYGPRYNGYNDRYSCDLSDLKTDDLSEILTELEKES